MGSRLLVSTDHRLFWLNVTAQPHTMLDDLEAWHWSQADHDFTIGEGRGKYLAAWRCDGDPYVLHTVCALRFAEMEGRYYLLRYAADGWKKFALFLRQNYGGWRWSILSRFWRILGVFVFGMSVCLFMSIWNGFGISWVMEFEWINETKRLTVRFCYQNVNFAKFWKLISKIMISNPKP